MNKEEVPIEHFDPKPAIKRNAKTARDWEYHEEAEYLYGMAVLFKDRFLDPILHTDRGRLPDPVISFDDATHSIQGIAERKAAYFAKHGEGGEQENKDE